MSIQRFVEIGVAACIYLLTATPAAAMCCEHHAKACCDEPVMTCCGTPNDAAAAAVLIPKSIEARPIRETLTVWFTKPTKVGDRILLGKYVIEHDNDRMARGKPCTYIYAAEDLQLPAVAFHCTHLDRPRSAHASVTLQPLGKPNGMQEFREFQFAGEAGAHGVPAGR